MYEETSQAGGIVVGADGVQGSFAKLVWSKVVEITVTNQSWAGYHNNTKWYQYQPYNLTVFLTLLAKHNTTAQHLCLQLVTTLMSG